VSVWEELLSTALVGTERRPVPELPGEGALGAALGRTGGVLDAAAVLTAYRRAGARPVTGIDTPEPAPAETQPVVSPLAAQRIGWLLSGDGSRTESERTALVDEWLTLAAARGYRVPPELLPDLLDAGRRRASLRPLLAAVGGRRGEWLAGCRPDWAYLRGEAAPTDSTSLADWEEGTPGRRLAYLTDLRRRDPAAARDLLAGTWAFEEPLERSRLLGVLADRLSADDEEFCESALDDRRKEVREVAADLLVRLPDSAYAARMAARASACVHLGGPAVTVSPPAECDRAMRRDGIRARPPAGIGERTWWLEEVLSRTPLSTWPDDLFDRRIADDWDGVLARALARAAATYRDAAWAARLLDRLGPLTRGNRRPDDELLIWSLYEALPVAELYRQAVRALREEPTKADRLLELCPGPWPPDLAEAVLTAAEWLARHGRHPYRIAELCRIATVPMPTTFDFRVAATAAALRAEYPDSPAVNPLFSLAETLRFRHQMHEELS